VLVMVLAAWLEKMQRGARANCVQDPSLVVGCVRAHRYHLPASGLIFREPDLGTTLLLGAVTMILLWAAGSPASWLGAITGTGAVFVAAFLVAIFKYDLFQDSRTRCSAFSTGGGRMISRGAITSSGLPCWLLAAVDPTAKASATAL